MKENSKNINRRLFIESAGLAAAGLTILPGSIISGFSHEAPGNRAITAATRFRKYSVLVERNVRVPTRDGIRLAATIYRPHTTGKFPTLLCMRYYQ